VVALAARSLRLVDRLLLAYLALAGIIAAFRIPSRPRAAWALVVYALVAALILLLGDDRVGRVGRTLREVYPIVLLPILYASLDLVNGFDIRVWDPVVRGWEELLFGGQISRSWWQERPSAFWSTLLHAAYFAYYLIVPLPVVWFLLTGRLERARETVTLILATFLLCYLCFQLFPVAGPYYEFPRPSGEFMANWAARLVYGTLDQGSSYGAAFPSSHVAATIAASIGAWRGSARFGLALAVPTGLLAVGVVYCQMHYAVDAVAGAAVALAVAAVGLRRGRTEAHESGRVPGRVRDGPTATQQAEG